MNLPKYCFDTHPLIWYLKKQKTLSSRAEKAIREVFSGKAIGVISTMVILETYYVKLKDPFFDFSKFLKIIDRPNIKIIPFDEKILEQSYILPSEIDIHDRVIVATSIVTGSQLISKDKILRDLFPLEVIW